MQLQEGIVEAQDEEQAIKKINDLGLFPVEVNIATQGYDASLFKSFRKHRKITKADIVIFTRQLANLLESGLNILPALNVLKTQVVSNLFVSLIDDISDKVKKGESFSESLASHEDFFSSLYINVVKSGELSGKLNISLESLANFLERREELRQKVFSALVYPLIVLSVGIMTVIILLTFVIPRIAAMYTEMGQALPIPTQIVVAVSFAIVHYFWIFILFIAGGFFLIKRNLKTTGGRDFIDRLNLSLPLLGPFVIKQHIVQFSRTLALLLGSGIPIVSALELVSDTLTNRLIKTEAAFMAKSIAKGDSLSDSMRQSKYFPPFVANIMSVAEESGTLEASLSRIANSFERDAENTIKTFTITLEPVLILFIGLIVGFIVVSMLLPIFQINLILG